MFQRLQSAAAVMRDALSALQWWLQHQLQAALTYSCFIPAPLLMYQLIIQHTAEKHNLQSWTVSFHASTWTNFYMHLETLINKSKHIVKYLKLLPALSWHSLPHLRKLCRFWAKNKTSNVREYFNHINTHSFTQLPWKMVLLEALWIWFLCITSFWYIYLEWRKPELLSSTSPDTVPFHTALF